MQQITRTIYRFHELSETAKECAKIDEQSRGEWFRLDEFLDSLNKLAEHFGGCVTGYEIDCSNSCSPSTASFEMPDMDREEIARRLEELGSYNPETLRGNGDCRLTGVCTDEDAIDGFRKAFHNGTEDLEALMRAAFRTWIDALHDEYQADYEDENFGEFCEANDFEFYADGSLYRRSAT